MVKFWICKFFEFITQNFLKLNLDRFWMNFQFFKIWRLIFFLNNFLVGKLLLFCNRSCGLGFFNKLILFYGLKNFIRLRRFKVNIWFLKIFFRLFLVKLFFYFFFLNGKGRRFVFEEFWSSEFEYLMFDFFINVILTFQ